PLWATDARKAPASKEIRIFLASSQELRDDRDEIDLYLRQKNDLLRKKGIYLEVRRWEHFLDAMSAGGSQSQYNLAVRECDIFLSLFFTKTGKYTEEEFDVAHAEFLRRGAPAIYTFFKDAEIRTGNANAADLQSLEAFKKRLSGLKHFWT